MPTQKTFPLQEKVTKLEEIQKYFHQPEMNLEVAIKKHKEALVIAKEILNYLDTAQNSLDQVDIQSLRKEPLS